MEKKNEDRFEFPFTLRDITAIGKERAWVVGNKGFIMRTIDGGESWEEVKTGVDSCLSTICTVDGNEFWVGGFDGILLTSNDGGETWSSRVLDGDYRVSSISAANGTVLWAALNHNDSFKEGKILKTMDGGLNWVEQDTGVKMSCYELHALDEMLVWAMGITPEMPRIAYILNTDNGGKSWNIVDSRDGSGMNSITVASKTILWGAGTFGRYSESYWPFIQKSTSGGKRWRNQKITGTESTGPELFMHSIGTIHAVNTKVAWAGGEHNLFARTVNGKDWEGGTLGSYYDIELTRIYGIDEDAAWAIGGPVAAWKERDGVDYYGQMVTVWLTTDGGCFWRQSYPPYTES